MYDDTLQLFGLNINNLLNRCTNTDKPWAATIPVSLPVAALEDQVAHRPPGGRLNKKDGLSRYGDSHVKDKTS